MLNRHHGFAAFVLALAATADAAAADAASAAWIVTASNTTTNQLLVYDTAGVLRQRIATGGQGGVSGNSGGIAQSRDRLAVVNFGSGTVSVFLKEGARPDLRLESVVPSVASPVSVAFGHEHLYILSTAAVESHRVDSSGIDAKADGVAGLLHADGTAAQVGVLPGELVFTEKSNAIETVALGESGAVSGGASLVAGIPANVNAPFGLVTRGNDAYVTIAHANEISLVRHDQVLAVTGSGSQSAPCWLALDGPFLFSSNSPSKSVSRYAVYGQVITQDAAVAATFNGNPTDIASRAGLAAVVDANSTASHLSIFRVDEDGHLGLVTAITIDSTLTNGVAIVRSSDRDDDGRELR